VSTPKDSLLASKGHDLPKPFGDPLEPIPGSTRDNGRVTIRTEEEQQAAAREREQQELVARKDARRKSLGKWVVDCQILSNMLRSFIRE